MKQKLHRRKNKRALVVLLLLILLWSLAMGWALELASAARATPVLLHQFSNRRGNPPVVAPQRFWGVNDRFLGRHGGLPLQKTYFWHYWTGVAQQNAASDAVGTVDLVPQRYQLGQELYLENCASCHIALPPAVLPVQTWQQLLQDSQHYGVQIKPLVDPPRLLVWNYLQTFSRFQPKEEETPYRVDKSRYFKALHPKVKLPRPIQISSCATCHPSAAQYNFRRLTPEWQNAQ